MSPPTSASHRRHTRIAAPLRAYDMSGSPPEAMLTRNIGLGGAFLLTARRRPVGSRIELLLEHRGATASVAGRVTHFQADGVGVAFSDPSEAFLAFVQRAVDDLIAGGAPTVDRRAEERSPVHAQVVWTGSGVEHRGRLENLTRKGALIECDRSPELGSEVLVYLPGYTYAPKSSRPSEARGCTARVVHREASGFGVQFVAPSAEFQMAVDRVLEDARNIGPWT